MNGSDRPGLSRAFFKGHGLGNDYLVFRGGDDWTATPGAVRRVCDRHHGAGSDGIVAFVGEAGGVRRLRMFNPDGSEFERSGNGLRVFAAFLAAADEARDGSFEVEVGGDRVRMEILSRTPGGVWDVTVEMGRPSFDAADVGYDPGRLGEEPGEDAPPGLPGGVGAFDLVPVSVGNPHCVVFMPEPTLSLLAELGPYLSEHPAFSRGTNVQVAAPVDDGRVRILIWERGVGRTSASGTSACAVAAAAVKTGRADPGEIKVEMEGGTLHVHVNEDLELVLLGPVAEVCHGELSEGFLEELDGS